jgi:hypothetical protein
VYLILLEITDSGFHLVSRIRELLLLVWEEMELDDDFVVIEKIMDEERMRKSKGESHDTVGSWKNTRRTEVG